MEETERTIRQLRVDARALQEDAEAAVAELARATRSLRDAVLDHARAGAVVRLMVGATVLAGQVVHLGEDVVRIVVADRGLIDVSLSAVQSVRVSPGSRGATAVSTGYPATLVARCRELLQVKAHVEIGRRTLGPVAGELTAATTTHVELDDRNGDVWLIPLGEVAWVARGDGVSG